MDEMLDRLTAIAAEIESSDARHRELLRQRDALARDAIDSGVPWTAVRAALRLSKQGLQIVLGRTLSDKD